MARILGWAVASEYNTWASVLSEGSSPEPRNQLTAASKEPGVLLHGRARLARRPRLRHPRRLPTRSSEPALHFHTFSFQVPTTGVYKSQTPFIAKATVYHVPGQRGKIQIILSASNRQICKPSQAGSLRMGLPGGCSRGPFSFWDRRAPPPPEDFCETRKAVPEIRN